MSPKTKTVTAMLALCLGSCLAIAQVGCLTPEQQAAVAGWSQQADHDASTILSLKAEMDKYRAELASVRDDLKAGKLPAASGLALADKIMGNISATQEKIAAAQADVKATQAKIAALKASGAPWWAYVLPAVLATAQIAGTVFPQLSFLVPVASAAQAQLSDKQARLSAVEGKLAVTQEVAGSLSRTLDAVVPPGNPELVGDKELAMLREQAADELAIKADYDEIRRLAQSGQI